MFYLSPSELEQQINFAAQSVSGVKSVPRLITLPGGASLRRYHRVEVPGGQPSSFVVMELGDDPTKSEEASSGTAPELPFLNVQRYLARAGSAVPLLYRKDLDHGLLYLEDLGDVTFESRVQDKEARSIYYRMAIDELIALQRYAEKNPDPDCVAFQRFFDSRLLKWELDHFLEWGLEANGHPLSVAEKEELDRLFDEIAIELGAGPRGFVHRDYQSRNLMVQDLPEGPRLRLIDFQDALLGPRAYDLVGLLRDSYVPLSPVLLAELVDYYVDRSGVERDSFRHLFDLQTVQRKLKDAGRFVFIDRVKKNPGFLKHVPSSLEYVAQALDRMPALGNLQQILADHLPTFSKLGASLDPHRASH
jgi:aminoglycoside/choline kinase family phosphotransferase